LLTILFHNFSKIKPLKHYKNLFALAIRYLSPFCFVISANATKAFHGNLQKALFQKHVAVNCCSVKFISLYFGGG